MAEKAKKAGDAPVTTRMVLRRRADGSTELTEAPDQHVLSAQKVAAEIETGLLEVTVTFRPTIGDPVVYDMVGFDVVDAATGQVNHGAWKLAKRKGD